MQSHKYIYQLLVLMILIIGLNNNLFANYRKNESVPEATTTKIEPFVFGDYKIYFSAFNSMFLSADIAQSYKINRSGNNAIINISVHKIVNNNHIDKKTPTSCSATAVKAKIIGNKANLLGQKTNLVFREIKEGDAIYYLAEIKISDGENLIFNLQATPESTYKALPTIKVKQVFYTEK